MHCIVMRISVILRYCSNVDFFILERFYYRCLSEATRAAIDQPIALDVSLVAWRDRSLTLIKISRSAW